MATGVIRLTGEKNADALLSKSPLALLVGMVLDQQIPLERAFAAPAQLKQRLGGKLDAKTIATMDPDRLVEAFSEKPALHRFPGSMAGRVQQVCSILVDEYSGKAEKLWSGADTGAELVARLKKLPGFGEQKAKIFGALLGKQLGVIPTGWREATAPFGDNGTFRSVADIVDEESLAKVRAFKQQMKAAAKAAAEAS